MDEMFKNQEMMRVILEGMMERSSESIYVKDREHRFVIINKTVIQNMGLSTADEYLGKTDEDYFGKEFFERTKKDEEELFKRGEPLLGSIEYRKVNGEDNWSTTDKIPLKDSEGNVIGLLGITRDITAQKQVEQLMEAMLEGRNMLRVMIDNIPDLVYAKDLEGRKTVTNRADLEASGKKEWHDVIGKTDFDLYPRDIAEQFWEDDKVVLEKGEIIRNREEPGRDKEGNPIVMLTTKVPLKNEKGEIIGLVGIGRDITERKKAEEELNEARKEAEAAAQAKSEFLANMSHEIRTPLNAIYGMTGLLLETPLNNEQTDFINTVRDASDTLLSVINDILDFSKIEAGKLDLEEQPFYLRSCIEGSLDLLAEKAASKMLDLVYQLQDNVPPVVIGDVTRLRQVLVNLINNSIKFTETGEIVVNVESVRLDNHNYELHFSVRDTGIGIPPERMDRLFKSFSQVDSSTTRKYGGTGLGLAISKQLVDKMNGRIWVESEVGVGSIFHFTIVVDVDPDAKPLTSWEIQPELEGKHILIVDDNATNRLILVKQTESWGMVPLAVESGPEALNLLKSGQIFDVAILDMQMPIMDGFTLAKKIEEMGFTNNLPMIILSSIMRTKARDDDAKISAFLSKPIKTSNLFNVLIETIGHAKSTSQEQEPKRGGAVNAHLGNEHPLRILLAEDNMVNQKVALKILERMGYRADLAANGKEVIEALKRQSYDVVLMDIQMPEMDGVEATHIIHVRWPKSRQPRIIAMTAHALEGDREKYLAKGMDDYISKPVRVDELEKALKKAKRLLD